MAYLVLVLQVLQLFLLSAKIYLHLKNAVEGLEGLVQCKPLWIYSNLVIIILYACKMQKNQKFIGMTSMHPLLNYLLSHLESCQDI